MRQAMMVAGRAAVAAALLALAPQAAAAQFGGLIRKAAEKATEKAVDKATGAEDKVAKSPSGAELTDDALERLLKGLAVTADRLGQREALQAQLEARDADVRKLREPNEVAIRSWESARSTWQECMSNQLSKTAKANEAQMQVAVMKLSADPKKALAYSQLAQKMSEEQQAAMAAGDTLRFQAAQAKYLTEIYKMLGVSLAADSAKARGTCGAEPKRLAVMAQIEALEKQRDSLQVRARDLESTAQAAGAKVATMDLAEFALQREKATTFVGAGNGGGFLTRDELNRLRAKRAELEKVKKAL